MVQKLRQEYIHKIRISNIYYVFSHSKEFYAQAPQYSVVRTFAILLYERAKHCNNYAIIQSDSFARGPKIENLRGLEF